jgi:hypothetical protein
LLKAFTKALYRRLARPGRLAGLSEKIMNLPNIWRAAFVIKHL